MIKRSIGMALLAGLTVVGPGAAAQATPGHRGWPQAITAQAESLHPEGVAWDPARRAFLVSSVRHGTVSVVHRDGTVTPLVDDPRMHSSFGVHVDAARGRIVVAYGDMGLDADPSTGGTGVGVFDLATGRPRHVVELDPDSGDHVANDVALDRRGNAYVTDTASDVIYRIAPDGRTSVFAQDARFDAGDDIGVNGIVWHPRGFLLAVRYDTGTLFRIDLDDPGDVRTVRLPRPLVGGDGMLMRRDGALVVVTNRLGAPGVDAVTVLRGFASWSSAFEWRRVEPWPVSAPTTIASSPHGAYVLSGRLDVLLGGDTSDGFDLHRLSRPRMARGYSA
ncbi:MAG: SMP-30/gluconolactonase/LRE family protein [Thermocrispum sp.]